MPTPPDRPDPAFGEDSPKRGESDACGAEKFPGLDDGIDDAFDEFDDDLDDDCDEDLDDDEDVSGEADDEPDDAVDWAVLARRYEIALADYRLDRGHLLWPAVAGAVDAAFTICDPVALLHHNSNPGARRTYERAAVRIWSGLWSAMLDTIGDRPDVLSIQQQQVHDVVRLVLEDEYGNIGSSSQGVAFERRFAEIINNEFGATSAVAPSPAGSVLPLRTERVELMAQLLAERLADFPWGSDEPF